GSTFIRQFSDEFFRHASRIYRKYANRCLTTNARFTKEHLAGFSVYRKAGNDVAELLKELLPSPDKLMEQGEIVKEGRTIRAARVQIGGKDYFLKRYNPKSFWYRFRNAFRRSRATKVWLNAWAFRYRNLPTAEPLICLEERHYRLLGRSYLLTEYVDDSEPLHLGWPHYDEQRKASLLVHISLLLAKMHRLGCIHGDLKWSNLLVRGEQVHLVDLDGSRILRRKDLPLFRKDIDRFIKDMEKYSAADFRKAFLALWQKRIR
ncbi:MAG: lipopolysaccharide kinase InaA family protein, partial [Desulfuromonadales bacterium]|nr:lipopolysaccharide kinase InaA family protein [Desulfuromonadales bacterium]